MHSSKIRNYGLVNMALSDDFLFKFKPNDFASAYGAI